MLDENITILEGFQVDILKRMYPELSDDEVKDILQIRKYANNFLDEAKVSTWDEYFDTGNESDYLKVADIKDTQIGVLRDFSRSQFGFNTTPEISDTAYFYMDPEAFEDIEVGDFIQGFPLFNVLYGGRKVEK